MANVTRDENSVPALLATSNTDGEPVAIEADPTTKRLLVNATISGGGASDGAITDGADGTIKASVLDYTNSNPLAVRLSDTNGDYVAAGAGTQYTEDAAAPADPVGGMLIARRKDTLSATEVSADGDNIALNSTAKGELYVKQTDAVPVTDNGGSLTVDGTVAISGTVTVDNSGVTQPVSAASLPLPTGAATAAKQPALGTAGTPSADVITVQGVTSMTALKVDGSGVTQPVSGSVTVSQATASNLKVDLSGTAANATAIKVDGSAVTQPVSLASLPASTNTLEVVGDVAHDAAAAGNPLRIGAKAETSLSGLTLVADGDATDLFAGVDGVLITRPHANLEDIVSGNASNTDGTSTSCIAAQGAGIKTYLTMIVLTNTSPTGTYCEIKDGTTVKLTIPVPANGGAVVPLPVPIGGTANTAWNFDPGAATTTMYCSLVGFKSKI